MSASDIIVLSQIDSALSKKVKLTIKTLSAASLGTKYTSLHTYLSKNPKATLMQGLEFCNYSEEQAQELFSVIASDQYKSWVNMNEEDQLAALEYYKEQDKKTKISSILKWGMTAIDNMPVSQAINSMIQDIFTSLPQDNIATLEMLSNAYATELKLLEENGRVSLFPTPFTKLNDFLLGGFHKNSLNMIGGFTGTGKSLLLIMLARFYAKQGYTVLYDNLEMADVGVIKRLIALESTSLLDLDTTNNYYNRTFRNDIYKKSLEILNSNNREVAYVSLLLKTLKDLEPKTLDLNENTLIDRNLSIVKKLPISFVKLRNSAELVTTVNATKPDIVIIDHLHLLEGCEEVAKLDGIIGDIKHISNNVNGFVLVGGQYNRTVKPDQEPQNWWFKNSSSIEQIADSIVHLIANKRDNNEVLIPSYISITKNRHGGTGSLGCLIDYLFQNIMEKL